MAADPITTAKHIYAGAALVSLTYGIYFTLAVICLLYLLSNRGQNRIVLAYTIVTFLATTIFLAASNKYTELIFIEMPINPTGVAKLSSRLDLLQQVVYSVKIWLADSLLIYRLWVVWGGNFLVTIVPSLLFTGAVASGIAGVALYDQADKHIPIVDLGIGFHSCSVALNVIATILIAVKLLRQRKLVEEFGEDHGRQYLSLTAVFAECGALYSITGLVYIPLYALNSPAIYTMAALLEAASGIAPSLIILRIALGVAVKRKRQPQLSALKFGSLKDADSTELGQLSVAQTASFPRSQRTFVNEFKEGISGS